MNGPAPATPADAPALAAIHAAGFDGGWDAAAIACLLASPGCFALWFPGRAFIMLRSVLDEAEIITIATAPAQRRLGLARRLLAAAAGVCMARGAGVLHLEVAEGNLAANRLYSSLEFEQVGRRPRYYADGAAALLLRLNLSATAAGPVPD